MDRGLIDEYRRGASVLGRASAGLTWEELHAFPVPGTWSIQQIVLHVMDSDLVGGERMKRVIAMEKPTLIGYDETAFAKALHYEAMDTARACQLFELNRLMVADVLERLPDAKFQRVGDHNEHGVMTLEEFVRNYCEHLEHHMKFLRQKRALLGNPLPA